MTPLYYYNCLNLTLVFSPSLTLLSSPMNDFLGVVISLFVPYHFPVDYPLIIGYHLTIDSPLCISMIGLFIVHIILQSCIKSLSCNYLLHHYILPCSLNSRIPWPMFLASLDLSYPSSCC